MLHHSQNTRTHTQIVKIRLSYSARPKINLRVAKIDKKKTDKRQFPLHLFYLLSACEFHFNKYPLFLTNSIRRKWNINKICFAHVDPCLRTKVSDCVRMCDIYCCLLSIFCFLFCSFSWTMLQSLLLWAIWIGIRTIEPEIEMNCAPKSHGHKTSNERRKKKQIFESVRM